MVLGISDFGSSRYFGNYDNYGNYVKDTAYSPFRSGSSKISFKSFQEQIKKNEKVGFWEGTKAFFKGLVKPVVNMIKHPIKTALFIAGTTALVIGTGGAALPLLIGAGIAVGGYQVAKGAYKAITADTKAGTLAGLEGMGEGTFTLGVSVYGAKSYIASKGVTPAANPEAETTLSGKIAAHLKNAGQAVKETVREIPESFNNCLTSVKSGEFTTNLQYVYKKLKLDAEGKKVNNPENYTSQEEYMVAYNKHRANVDAFNKEFGFDKAAKIYRNCAEKGYKVQNYLSEDILTRNPLKYMNLLENPWNANLAIGVSSEFGNGLSNNELEYAINTYGPAFGLAA